MSELIPRNDVTKEALEAIYGAAFFETTRDSDDDLVVRVGPLKIMIQVLPTGMIRMTALFRPKPDATPEDILTAVNEFNAQSSIVKVYWVGGEGRRIVFEADLRFDGGLVPMNLVHTLRQFDFMVMRSHSVDRVIG